MAKFSIGLMKKYHTPKCTLVFALRELNGINKSNLLIFFTPSHLTREKKKKENEKYLVFDAGRSMDPVTLRRALNLIAAMKPIIKSAHEFSKNHTCTHRCSHHITSHRIAHRLIIDLEMPFAMNC